MWVKDAKLIALKAGTRRQRGRRDSSNEDQFERSEIRSRMLFEASVIFVPGPKIIDAPFFFKKS